MKATEPNRDVHILRDPKNERGCGKLLKTDLYRHYDANGRLLYVGVSLSAVVRLAQHRDLSQWATQIARVDVQKFDTRDQALAAERAAIKSEKPLHNIMHQEAADELPETRGDDAKQEIIRRIVEFAPLYTLSQVARVLSISEQAVRTLILAGDLGAVEWSRLLRATERGPQEAVSYRVTGWQLIEFVEHLETKRAVRSVAKQKP
ncbi:hypothetical protein KTR66_09600 [Roseococcus sp. SDR]|uniref:hypothetical protein n=1 Tax=Roseococcus sp. SDR TaxID=2835532 RepID=UPI001BCCF10E|nr:hypothetical protein [Roseococcus sp. SDR]MBS7790250.1 hypothetical protein [Roseococcus sp. SDR]MBV1845564.1 hypothetical protein [Roseococcus sp. SDR]